ncbi:nitrile hydratase accessory protein [Aminobacter sp. MSH1]|uniref:nitrile hydratase accessory protein n=1 Tax=Aminobacter sp. MSH1 TaxID=374606 RepID=UPI000D33330A|nr:nitrile hydratase accessory protein [Aminobacter sp. MSH1]
MSTANNISKDNPELAKVLNRSEGQAPFNKPWELRVFSVAVAACEAGEFEWAKFQEALTEAIRNWEVANPGYSQDEWNYYEHFVTALEVVLARSDKLSSEGLDERARIILDNPPHHHHVATYDPIRIDPARH